jgi:hypothetical protein
MMRHLGSVLTVLVIAGWLQLAFSTGTQAQTRSKQKMAVVPLTMANLQLVIEGPFVLCETANSILVAIPKLNEDHYPPGFTAGLYEYPLGNNGKYPDYTHYALTLNHNGGGGVHLVSDGNGTAGSSLATLYREHGNCNNVSAAASIVVTVPKPDEIWPLAAGVEEATIWDTKPLTPGSPTGNPTGPCTSGTDCKHANRVVLRYLDTDLNSVILTCDSAASHGPCPPPGPPTNPLPSTWTLGADLVSIGQEAELRLDAQPVVLQTVGPLPILAAYPSCRDIIVSNAAPASTVTIEDEMREEEADAFCAATTMAFHARYIMPTPTHIAPTHRDCKAAVSLICQNSSTCP